ncbi:RRP12 [Candida pseudojiufengensis]|uniref:RRP12 n=1 Tax=Candida pseudojiufengensis TaxID=497109 RepID=UPI00222538CA|nr:RRP12 [Candida pseudojiufengensis]KAI5960829.1 RRP12 [Candida pseudojiufengensis]
MSESLVHSPNDGDLLQDRLSKIRSQMNSKLENQKHLAIILSAVEENIEEQKNDKTPVAYFVSFLSLLDQCIKNDEIIDNDLATTTAYFLDIIFPFTPKPLLKQKFNDILLKLSQPLNLNGEAPLIRSTIGAMESLLLAQDNSQWLKRSAVSPNRAFMAFIELSFDPRPKVRRRAQEAVKNILLNPPPSPSPVHVAAVAASDASLTQLISLLNEFKKQRKSNPNKDFNTKIIHCLQLITIITSSNSWPVKNIEKLCDALLEISKTSDQYLVGAAFEAFEGLFKSMTNSIDVDKYTKVLNAIFDLKPSINDSHLAASWLSVVAKALEGFSSLSPIECLKKISHVLTIVSQFLASESKDIYTSASQCLIAIIVQTIPDKFLLQPNKEYEITEEIYNLVDDTITFIAELIEKELFSIKYQNATGEILQFVTATILKLKSRSNPDFLNIVEIVGDWRTNEADNFPHNKEAEDCIGASVSSMGPQAVLSILPLNLTGKEGGAGRAWLLPILRDNVKFSELEFYKLQILPFIDFFETKINESNNKESMNNKIFQTIIDQIWSLLPKFCDLPGDLITAFDETFATKLSDLMFAKVELRTFICHAWRTLVESNIAYRDGAFDDDLLLQQEYPKEKAVKAIEYLSSISSNILTVLFNVFTYTMTESRGFVLETIEAYLKITPPEELSSTFDKVCGMLKNALDEEAEDENNKKNKNKNKNQSTPETSVTMMDLIVVMTKYLPDSSHNALFSIFSLTISLESHPLLQKRAYRIISKLSESKIGKESILKYITNIESKIIETATITNQTSRTARLHAILLIIKLLPSSELYFIPSILQEIIMATKDVNERSRGLSYQILIKMGEKMIEGGIIENSKVPGFDSSIAPTEASLNEFFTMVSAGLASQNPHMISATITAISCLIFEFKNKLSVETLIEISSTIELFLTHNSREIAKSAIGFVKMEILSLPEQLIKENLSELLKKLMKWSHEHKGHFKSKVKHIIERLIRKFGIEEIEKCIPEEDKKLVLNIKKSKLRAKRKQLQDPSEAEDSNTNSTNKKFVSAYEEALYDSDISDDDEEEVDIYDEDSRRHNKQNRNKKSSNFILESNDEPLNLLDRQALAHISSSKPKNQKSELRSKTEEFKTKNGKLIFNEKENSINEDPLSSSKSGIDAYLDAVKQAPIRGQKNKLKFKKNTGDDEENWSNDEEDEEPKRKKSKVLGRSKIQKPIKKRFKAQKKF